MSKIKILIVEDEAIVSKDIETSLIRLGYNIVGCSSTGEKALEITENERPDVVLMDIMLKGSMNGIETATLIREAFEIPVIFLTAYADDATILKAKLSQPYGYILKPFKEVDLKTAIEMTVFKHGKEQDIVKQRDMLSAMIERGEGKSTFFFVRSNNKLVKLNTDEIYYVEALKDYVIIHTLDTRHTIHSTMKDIESKIGNKDFIRVHRSFIVNIDKIASIEYPNLTLEQNKKTIPIGGSYKDELNKRIKLV